MKRLVLIIIPVLIYGAVLTSCGSKRATNDNTKVKTTQVLTLGTFHFEFPNLDAEQTAEEDQIDVLLPEFQKEIESIVEKLSVFQPTVVAIECDPDYQDIIDSVYNQYLLGKYQLRRNESMQIGFRIAKAMGLKKLHCVDEYGIFTENINNILNNEESEEYRALIKSFDDNADSSKVFRKKPLFKTKGILAELIQSNDEENIKKDLGNYLIGDFKHEYTPYDYTGVDFETGRWFNRNLRIFRNIQRVETDPSDRILVIFGCGHLNILNYLFECSHEYTLVKANDFLRK